MEIIHKTLDSILVKCHDIQVDNFKYGELVVLIDSDYESEYSGIEEDFEDDTGDIANESSVEDVLEIVKQATIAKKEPTIYEIEFGNVSNSSDRCSFDDLIKFLHSLGMSPTKEQCEELKKEFGNENIDFESALKAYSKISGDKYTSEELMVSLSSTSSDINRKRLILLLQTFGDKMTEDEINKSLDKLNFGDGAMNKQLFIEKLCEGSKQIRSSTESDKTNESLEGQNDKNENEVENREIVENDNHENEIEEEKNDDNLN